MLKGVKERKKYQESACAAKEDEGRRRKRANGKEERKGGERGRKRKERGPGVEILDPILPHSAFLYPSIQPIRSFVWAALHE